ncbi:hypothetical protein SAMN04487818_102438 [Actinokineospora terrae]|uniref:Uncharacterized protein n=1 Tax=Actinokineospora terrae TaxID=155974 RepID=A0A1H9N0F8_9PSEU|nr:DUF6880 family protein [Actinokineospora terrae]SER29378.1 hypothetical protein SAMN04487818_102438 [Actinokineospora terrae]
MDQARLREVVEADDYIDEDGVDAYLSGVREALREVERLIRAGSPNEAIALTEYAITALERVEIDDVDGALVDVLDRAQEIHLDACAAGTPDPAALAESLVTLALDSENGVFVEALPEYGQILGQDGLRRYRELLDREDAVTTSRQRRYVLDVLAERLVGASAY